MLAKMRKRTHVWSTSLTDREDDILKAALKEAVEIGRVKTKSDFTRQALLEFAAKSGS
jgi:hypothetical protein